jgi:hypothetical protein
VEGLAARSRDRIGHDGSIACKARRDVEGYYPSMISTVCRPGNNIDVN